MVEQLQGEFHVADLGVGVGVALPLRDLFAVVGDEVHALGVDGDALEAVGGVGELAELFLVLCILRATVEGEDEREFLGSVVVGGEM